MTKIVAEQYFPDDHSDFLDCLPSLDFHQVNLSYVIHQLSDIQKNILDKMEREGKTVVMEKTPDNQNVPFISLSFRYDDMSSEGELEWEIKVHRYETENEKNNNAEHKKQQEMQQIQDDLKMFDELKERIDSYKKKGLI